MRDQQTTDRQQVWTLGRNVEDKFALYSTLNASQLMFTELDAKVEKIMISMQSLQDPIEHVCRNQAEPQPQTAEQPPGPERFDIRSPMGQTPTSTLRPPVQPGLTPSDDPIQANDAWAQYGARAQSVARSPFLTEMYATQSKEEKPASSPFAAAGAAYYSGDSVEGRHGALGEIDAIGHVAG